MKKRIVLASLSLASLLALSGCAKKISEEDAKAVATEIVKRFNNQESEEYKNLKNGKLTAEGFKGIDYDKVEFAVDLNDGYYYMSSTKDKKSEIVAAYKKDGDYYVYEKSGEEESYSPKCGELSYSLTSLVPGLVYAVLVEFPYLTLESWIEYDTTQEESVTTYEYTSSGEGNLTMKVDNSKDESIEEDEPTIISLAFDKFVPSAVTGEYKNGDKFSIKYDFKDFKKNYPSKA